MHGLPRYLTLRQTLLLRPRPVRIPRIQSRFQSQTRWRPDGQAVQYQTVRFKRPPITFRKFITWTLYGAIAYGYGRLALRYIGIEIEVVEDDGEQAQQQDGDESGLEVQEGGPFYSQEDSLFIPMTWSTKLPRQFYRGSDPEWQEFVKVAKDKTRIKKIQDELVQVVFLGCSKHPAISRQLGTEPKIGKYWLDISFPDAPPPDYIRSGLEFGDGFVAWSQQKVDEMEQSRLMRALWPQATASSSWATVKALAGIQYRRVKQTLGLEAPDPSSPEGRTRHALDMVAKQASEEGTDPDPPKASSPPANDKDWHLPSVPLPSFSGFKTSLQTDSTVAALVFSGTLSKSWNPKKQEPPKGSFVVQGLVEVRGSRGRFLFDVQSAYDPKKAKYVSVNANVRGYKRWSQAPRGGP